MKLPTDWASLASETFFKATFRLRNNQQNSSSLGEPVGVQEEHASVTKIFFSCLNNYVVYCIPLLLVRGQTLPYNYL